MHAYISYIAQDVGLVFVSADKEAYEELRIWKDLVLEVIALHTIRLQIAVD